MDDAIELEATKEQTVIRPVRGWVNVPLRELWERRELYFFLVWRDVAVRYKQTVLGMAWAILQPLLGMVVFTLFFGRLGGMRSDGVPYPLFSFTGLTAWTFFGNALAHASNSVVDSSQLVSKVYFPRILIPLAAISAGWADFVLSLLVLLGIMFWYGYLPGIQALSAFGFMGLVFASALGAGLWLSALNVRFRDMRYVVPFLVQLWLFATPVIYPRSALPADWQVAYSLNPLAAALEGFRWALLGTPAPSALDLGLAALAASGLLISGAIYFRQVERNFADIV